MSEINLVGSDDGQGNDLDHTLVPNESDLQDGQSIEKNVASVAKRSNYYDSESEVI